MTYLELLETLTKEQLVKVIANYADTFQDLDGYGLSDDDAKAMSEIGYACKSYCSARKDWSLDFYPLQDPKN